MSLHFLLVIFLLGFFLTPALTAQDTEGSEAPAFNPEQLLDAIVVSATRTSQALSKVTSSVSVVTRDEIEKTPGASPLDLLRNTPGVTIQNRSGEYGSSSTNRVVIRGMGSNNTLGRVLILTDGMLSVSPDNGIFEWNGIDSDIIERIEVIRGPSSALYGSNAMGGVINIITKKRLEDGHDTTIKTKFGSYDFNNTTVNSTGKKGPFSYGINAGYRRSEGFNLLAQNSRGTSYRRNVNDGPEEVKNTLVALRAGYQFDDDTDALLSYYYNDYSNTGRYFKIPDYNIYSGTTHTFTIQFHNDFGFMDSKLNFRAEFAEADYDSANTNGTLRSYDAPNKTQYYFLDFLNTLSINEYNRLTFGLSSSLGKFDREYHYFSTNRYRAKGGKQLNLAAFIQDEISLFDDILQIVPGVRYDYWQTDGYEQDTDLASNPGKISYPKASDRNISSKIGLNLNPWHDKVIFRANYGQAYRIASLQDRFGGTVTATLLTLPNPQLKPEKSWTIDFGVEVNPIDILNLSLTAYRTDAKDFMSLEYIAPAVRQRINLDRARIQGLEFAAKFYPGHNWTIFSDAEINDSKVTSGVRTGEHFVDTPENKFSIGFIFSDPKWFTVRASAVRYGKIWVSQDPRAVEGNVWVGDLRISRKFEFQKFWLEPFLEVNNINNRMELRFTSYNHVIKNTVYGGFAIGF
jgi:outer membrane receptor protein involved in Fe transport